MENDTEDVPAKRCAYDKNLNISVGGKDTRKNSESSATAKSRASSAHTSPLTKPAKETKSVITLGDVKFTLTSMSSKTDFRQHISALEHLKGFCLQDRPCAIGLYEPCISCFRSKDKKRAETDCRFFNRMLRSEVDPKVFRRLTVEDVSKIDPDLTSYGNANEFEKARMSFGGAFIRSSGNNEIAAYLVQCCRSEYKKIVDREKELMQLLPPGESPYFSHSYRVNQICDDCQFSILNAHFCCTTCGLELCPSCFDELKCSGNEPSKWQKKLSCVDGSFHDASQFHLGSFLIFYGTFEEVLKMVEKQFNRYAIQEGGGVCNGVHGRKYNQTNKCYCPVISNEAVVPIERICIITDQMSASEYGRFKAHMAVHHPVIVEGVDRQPDYCPSLWTQQALADVLARSKKVKVLDSLTFEQAIVDGEPCTLDHFWKKFASKHVEGEPYLKVKDFPETLRFRDVAPKQYENLFKVLPFLEYTHVNARESGRGRLNLLNVFNNSLDPPDPGPKLYICYGMCDDPSLASTPLHLDVSNAVNFLPYVQAPNEMTIGEIRKGLEERLALEDIDEDEKARALRNPQKAGALWKIFHPEDNDAIRKAIVEYNALNRIRSKPDVIHNQNVIVTPDMMRFFKSQGITCNVFVQSEGEVVFVPSGAAHLVQNLHSCVKVAEDFVAVEGIEHHVEISRQLRALRAKSDLIRIDTAIHRACCSAVAKLHNSHPGLFAPVVTP